MHSLMHSVHARKEFRGPKWTPKYNLKNFYFNPKAAPIETLWWKKHQNPSDGKSHTRAPLSIFVIESKVRSKLLVPRNLSRLSIQRI